MTAMAPERRQHGPTATIRRALGPDIGGTLIVSHSVAQVLQREALQAGSAEETPPTICGATIEPHGWMPDDVAIHLLPGEEIGQTILLGEQP